ncbi:hypothetical protein pb186bvf_006103 [Paramecium bursaria]
MSTKGASEQPYNGGYFPRSPNVPSYIQNNNFNPQGNQYPQNQTYPQQPIQYQGESRYGAPTNFGQTPTGTQRGPLRDSPGQQKQNLIPVSQNQKPILQQNCQQSYTQIPLGNQFPTQQLEIRQSDDVWQKRFAELKQSQNESIGVIQYQFQQVKTSSPNFIIRHPPVQVIEKIIPQQPIQVVDLKQIEEQWRKKYENNGEKEIVEKVVYQVDNDALDELQNQVDSLNQEKQDQADEILRLQAELNNANQSIDYYKQQIQSLQNQNNQLKQQLKDKKPDQSPELLQNLANLELQLDDKNQEIQGLNSQLDDLRSDNDQLRSENDDLRDQLNKLQGGAQDELQKLKNQIKQLSTQVDSLKSQNGSLQNDNDDLRKQIDELNQLLDDKDRELQELSEQISELEVTVSTSSSLEGQVKYWKQKFSETSNELHSVQEEVTNLKTQIEVAAKTKVTQSVSQSSVTKTTVSQSSAKGSSFERSSSQYSQDGNKQIQQL